MPKATRSFSSQAYRANPLASTSQNDRYKLRQQQAHQTAQQQAQIQRAQAQLQQQQDLFFPDMPNMQSISHIGAGQHISYGQHQAAPLPSSLYMPQQTMSHQVLPQPTYTQAMPTTSVAPSVTSRPSSGAWSPSHDSQLMTARAAGQNWSQIQAAHFPGKTANACRKRHERLMDRRNSDDWDALKLETLGREYMANRKEIWGPLAEKCGEKWAVVEAKVLSSGLKNLQSAARASHRRARLSNGGYVDPNGIDPHTSSYTDDSALGDDLDDYGNSPETDYENYDGSAQQHHRQQSQSQYQPPQMMGGMRGQYIENAYTSGMGLPQQMMARQGSHSHTNSLGSNFSNGGRDMGIRSIINRTGGV